MMEKRCEPRLLVPPCYFAYASERTGRACPALRPERVLLSHVSLGQTPSLRRFRRRFLGFVQRLRRYHGSVRLPLPVHHRITASGLPDASRRAIFGERTVDLPVLAHGVSAHARGLRPRGVAPGLALSPGRVLPSAQDNGVGTPEDLISRLNTLPERTPVNASTTPSRVPPHDSGPSWVASPSMYDSLIRYSMPVYPGASVLPASVLDPRHGTARQRAARGGASADDRASVAQAAFRRRTPSVGSEHPTVGFRSGRRPRARASGLLGRAVRRRTRLLRGGDGKGGRSGPGRMRRVE
jgi:hypothetical protein